MKIVEPKEVDVNEEAFKVFIKAIELIGGLEKLVEYRNLTWLPSLAVASYAVVLKEHNYTKEQIAEKIGVSTSTVERILEADPEKVIKKIHQEIPKEEAEKEHTAGGLAKLALQKLKEGDEPKVLVSSSKAIIEAVEGPAWAVAVLVGIKGTDFPVESPEILKEKLKGIYVDGHPIEGLLEKIEYPIKSVSELLKKLKEAK
jgi:probable regulatory domain-containing protein